MLGSNVRTQVLDDSGTKALATAVDVEAVAAQKADQRLIRSLGQIARQAGWRRNGDQHRNAGLQRLLDDLEGGAPAHHEDVPAEGDQLTIDGVAAAREPRSAAEDLRQMLLEQLGKSYHDVKVEFKALEDVETVANLGGTNVPMSRYVLSITFNPTAPAKSASPAPGRKKQKSNESS